MILLATYEVKDTDRVETVAVKIEDVKAKHPQLIFEAKILSSLQGKPGIPTLHYKNT